MARLFLFTPNVPRGRGKRYWLYADLEQTLFSLSPEGGETYPFRWVRASCGLGCRCAARITWTTPEGREALRLAPVF